MKKGGSGSGGADWFVANGAGDWPVGSTCEMISNGVHSVEFSLAPTSDTVGFFFVNQRPDNRIAAGGDDNALEFPRYDIESFAVHALFLQYASWADGYGLTEKNARATTDIEPDGLDNLLEYALGGNPTNDDAVSIMPQSFLAESGGTNWLEYVYRRRSDYEARGLSYVVECSTSLLASIWSTNGIEELNTGKIDAEFDLVTKRISTATEDKQFLRLKIEE